ncbi:MFS transporter [Kitasatospora acidiphila]|uniref:MFS transporter n=1 Tax=Kitasatospora acidiphila TaxID=2567942 RepID=UPI001E639C74|nr:MFS transporter [Kitasatospora acidiphila]
MTLTQPKTRPDESLGRPERPHSTVQLLRAAGGTRYAAALVVDALGAGLLRPFLLLYGVSVLGLSAGRAGLALSLGLLAGLAALPLVGRWIDRGARSLPVAVTLLVRAVGVLVLLLTRGPVGFTLAAVLLGVGSQCWPTAHAATVATLVEGRVRDAALAAGRSLRNAGLGAGALIATVAISAGTGALRGLAVVTAAACVVAAALVWSLRVAAPAAARAQRKQRERGPAGGLSTVLSLANLPFAFCFDVLEVALPALLVTRLRVSPAWSSGIFVGNTVLVITTQLAVVLWLAKRSRRSALTLGGAYWPCPTWVSGWPAGSAGRPVRGRSAWSRWSTRSARSSTPVPVPPWWWPPRRRSSWGGRWPAGSSPTAWAGRPRPPRSPRCSPSGPARSGGAGGGHRGRRGHGAPGRAGRLTLCRLMAG